MSVTFTHTRMFRPVVTALLIIFTFFCKNSSNYVKYKDTTPLLHANTQKYELSCLCSISPWLILLPIG